MPEQSLQIIAGGFTAGSDPDYPASRDDHVSHAVVVENYFKCEVLATLELNLLDSSEARPADPTIACYSSNSQTRVERQKKLLERPTPYERLRGEDPERARLRHSENVDVGSCPSGETSPYRIVGIATVSARRASDGVLHTGDGHSSPKRRGAELFVK
jgi:hypothetical protein